MDPNNKVDYGYSFVPSNYLKTKKKEHSTCHNKTQFSILYNFLLILIQKLIAHEFKDDLFLRPLPGYNAPKAKNMDIFLNKIKAKHI